MQLDYINQNEKFQSQVQEKQTKRTFSYAVGCSMLLLFLLLMEYLFIYDIFYFFVDIISAVIGSIIHVASALSYEDARTMMYSSLETTEFKYIFTIVTTIVTDIIPFYILARLLKIKPLSAFKVNTDVPKKFWLYIPFAIGTGYLVNIIVNLIFGGLFRRFAETESVFPTTPLAIILFYIMIAFVPAIFEEWAFRGILLRSLLPYGKGLALIVSSILFGVMHIGPQRVIFATIFGMIAGYIYIKTGSIWYGSLIHLLNNSLSCIGGLAAYYKGARSGEVLFIGLLLIGIIITAVVGMIYFMSKGYFKERTLHSITPPGKPKLMKKQYTKLSLLNGVTIGFVLLYVITLIVEFFPEVFS